MNSCIVSILVAIRVSMTDWHPPHIKPVHVGIYKVRIQVGAALFPGSALWNGTKWMDTSTGLECYFQNVEFQGVTQQGLDQIEQGRCVV